MRYGSREHSSAEFGRSPASGAVGMDAPLIGASSLIALDGMVEREAGVTPPPPPFSIRTALIALVVMVALAAGWSLRQVLRARSRASLGFAYAAARGFSA